MFLRFAKAHGVTAGGAVGGVAGFGTVVIRLAFGRKVHRALMLIGAVLLTVFIFDYLPMALAWRDIPVATGTAVLCTGFWLRRRDVPAIAIVCMPTAQRLYTLLRQMSSWGFIALSFLLLFLGGAVSLFCKRKKEPRYS
jgi:hypothetical protein